MKDSISNAQIIAASILGTGTCSGMRGASLQRSLRVFAPHLFEIENMAAKTGGTVSVMLGLVLEAGLEAIRSHLPDETKDEIKTWTQEQTARLVEAYPVMQSMLDSVKIRGAQ